jgi:hypothetical protein
MKEIKIFRNKWPVDEAAKAEGVTRNDPLCSKFILNAYHQGLKFAVIYLIKALCINGFFWSTLHI